MARELDHELGGELLGVMTAQKTPFLHCLASFQHAAPSRTDKYLRGLWVGASGLKDI